MTDLDIRTLDVDEHRAARDLFLETLHVSPTGERDGPLTERAFQPGRTLGAFEGGAMVGTARSVDVALTVPGGVVSAAAVTGVGVRANRTRRGLLRGLMAAQLDGCASRGVVAAGLLASEGGIYGRFGYGIGTVERSLRLDRRRTSVREDAPAGGEIELWDFDTAVERLPGLYRDIAGTYPGMLSRPDHLWAGWESHFRRRKEIARAAVHHGSSGVDGYAMYRVTSEHAGNGRFSVLCVEDMITASPEARAGLWRYLLGVDLIDTVEFSKRPLDEPLELLLTEPHACRVHHTGDHLWLRLVDVPAALAARSYGACGDETVVLEVRDSLLPDNSGSYAIGCSGVARTEQPAQLVVDVDALAMLYLGAWRPGALAETGRLEVRESGALAVADRVFATSTRPWCGTSF
ncbi:GNAT family N-acetyltransferase [Haloechinothrix sp. LS1_15]|uniref:GNAT family N-acetyltransferase n=1 Tax=Haloechinothrix sp. LS1_15 TaxID=2652248 RepID=UPI002944C738|nr:GNAT family N-acetyltransferase [Haloechinothrix sp. LS1_15]MDV6014000.1 GNAT family N-acetyltransferase [Haloechinothrix sp. LS1_15]